MVIINTFSTLSTPGQCWIIAFPLRELLMFSVTSRIFRFLKCIFRNYVIVIYIFLALSYFGVLVYDITDCIFVIITLKMVCRLHKTALKGHSSPFCPLLFIYLFS